MGWCEWQRINDTGLEVAEVLALVSSLNVHLSDDLLTDFDLEAHQTRSDKKVIVYLWFKVRVSWENRASYLREFEADFKRRGEGVNVKGKPVKVVLEVSEARRRLQPATARWMAVMENKEKKDIWDPRWRRLPWKSSSTQLGPRGTGHREEWRPAKKDGHLSRKC